MGIVKRRKLCSHEGKKETREVKERTKRGVKRRKEGKLILKLRVYVK